MAAKSQNAAAGPANVPQQQLQDCRRSDDLDTIRMLRPSHRIADCSGFIGARSRRKGLGNFNKFLFGNSAGAFNQLRRIAGKMFFQYLKYAAWMGQRGIIFVLARISSFTTSIFSVSSAGRSMSGQLAIA